MSNPDSAAHFEPRFTALERQVIAIGLSAGEPPIILTGPPAGRWQRWRRIMFGHRPPVPLADPRLEVLRAMAATVRCRPHDPDPRIGTAFLAAGGTDEDIDRIRQMAVARWLRTAGADRPRGSLYGVGDRLARPRIEHRPETMIATDGKRLATVNGSALLIRAHHVLGLARSPQTVRRPALCKVA